MHPDGTFSGSDCPRPESHPAEACQCDSRLHGLCERDKAEERSIVAKVRCFPFQITVYLAILRTSNGWKPTHRTSTSSQDLQCVAEREWGMMSTT